MRTVAAGVVLLLAAVSGCSAEEVAPAEVGPLASGAAPSSTTPTPSASAKPVVVPESVLIPTPAQLASPQGASAFTRYYFGAVVNQAYASRDATTVEQLSASSCRSCANILADVARLRAAGRHVAGSRFDVHLAEAAPPEADGSVIVDFRFSSDPYIERDETGTTIRTEPAQVLQDAQVKLVRRGDSWVVAAIRTV